MIIALGHIFIFITSILLTLPLFTARTANVFYEQMQKTIFRVKEHWKIQENVRFGLVRFISGDFVAPSQRWVENCTRFGEDLGQSSTNILYFRYVAPFQNQGDSKATGVENRGQILHFFASVKLGEGWTKCLSEFFVSGLGPSLW